MRNILISVLSSLVITVVVVWGYSKWNTPKIGYIKSAIILQDYKEMAVVTEQFNNELKVVKTNLDTLQTRYEKLKMMEPIITEKEKNNWSYRLGIAQSEYEKYNQQASEQMAARKGELTQKVLETINNFIQKYGKDNHYKLILGTTNEGSILYGQEADDLTQTLLGLLNQGYESKSSVKAENK